MVPAIFSRTSGLVRDKLDAWGINRGHPSILLAIDALIAGSLLKLVSGFGFARVVPTGKGSALIAVLLMSHALTLQYSRAARGRAWRLGQTLVGTALAAAATFLIFGRLGFDRDVLAAFFVIQALVHGLVRMVSDDLDKREALLRWAILIGSVTYLFSIYTERGSPGGADGYWYGLMLGDFVTQLRSGVFPAFVGQSVYAFNGLVFPHRLAPYFQHAAGLLDLLTGQCLTFSTLLNLLLFLGGAAGAISAWHCARRILPAAPWTCLALALLFISSPGVLALFYTGGLYMSVMTLPFVPLVLLGIWQAGRLEEPLPVAAVIAPLAAAWFCHPPIAFWMNVAVAGALAIRWALLWRTIGQISREVAACGLAFVLLTSFCFVSALTLGPDGITITWEVPYSNIVLAFPGVLLPVSRLADQISDYQLGWSLWTVLLIAAGAWAFRRERGLGLLLLVVIGLLVFLLPVPVISKAGWSRLPHLVLAATLNWPMQRLCVILAGTVLIAGAAAWSRFIPGHPATRLAGALLWLGVGWSDLEAGKFITRGRTTLLPSAATELSFAPNNVVLSRYGFVRFPLVPAYYSHGFVDPVLAHRVISTDESRELLSNESSARQLPEKVTPLHGVSDGSMAVVITPKFLLEPGPRHYLVLEWLGPDWAGMLTATGDTVSRSYWMPDSGIGMRYATVNRSFGHLPNSSTGFPVWILGKDPERLELRVHLLALPTERVPLNFLRVHDHAYTPEMLPIRVESLAPYRVHLASPEPGLLETPRMFIEGYRATVNGQPVAVRATRDGLAAVPLPAGPSDITMEYSGTPVLRTTYWLTLASWLALGLWWVGGRKWFLRARSRTQTAGP